MIVKDIVPTDFLNYKKPSMYIAFPHCTFKCERDCGIQCCQNSALVKNKNIEISIPRIIELYRQNSTITKALLLCGLEPFDDFEDLLELVTEFRKEFEDDVVIYTGYNEDEIIPKVRKLKMFPNIIIKYGRYVPNQEAKYDEILGVKLASPNQYAVKIS